MRAVHAWEEGSRRVTGAGTARGRWRGWVEESISEQRGLVAATGHGDASWGGRSIVGGDVDTGRE